MKTFLEFNEDVGIAGPTNTTGSGAVAGMGQPPGSKSGEPGVDQKKKKKALLFGQFRRSLPKM